MQLKEPCPALFHLNRNAKGPGNHPATVCGGLQVCSPTGGTLGEAGTMSFSGWNLGALQHLLSPLMTKGRAVRGGLPESQVTKAGSQAWMPDHQAHTINF